MAALVPALLVVVVPGAASAGWSGASPAARASGVQPRTLAESRLLVRAFAQDGGRIAWISPKREHGRPAGCALRIRELRSGRTTVTLLGRAGCPSQHVWPGALALAGRSAGWVAGAECGNSECLWSVMRAAAGDRRARVVAGEDVQCSMTCEFEDLQPLLAGAGRLLAYSYVTLGQVKRIATTGVRSLFAISGDVRGLVAGGGRVAAVSLTLGGGPGRLDAPFWSPDGTKLAVAHGAFLASDSAAVPVAVMNADGTGLRDLPSSDTCVGGSYLGAGLAWSPDGQRIAYDDCWPRIWVVNADGSGGRLLTEGAGPAWSPDGTAIAFERDIRNNAAPAIYLMDPDGSNIRELASPGTGSQHQMGPLAWSPDGTRIAFSLDGSLEVMNADGSSPHQLGSAKGDEPTWSPDSSQIAFRGGRGLFVIGADGTGLHQLTRGRGDHHPSWSPDGQTIVFARGAFTTIDGQELRDLYAVDPDGGNLRPFAVPPVRVESTTTVHSSKGRTTFAAAGTPAGVALGGKFVAVGSVAAGVNRITLFNASSGTPRATVELGDGRRFWVAGADAHWIVFQVGQRISALKIDSRKVVRLASPTVRLMDLSVSGRRVAWLERFPNGHSRIRALNLPS